VTADQLMRIGISQERWLNRHADVEITLPYVPGVPSRFRQRPCELPTDRRGSNMKLTRRTFVRLVHMRGSTAAIPEG
jgi:hypothetical protein